MGYNEKTYNSERPCHVRNHVHYIPRLHSPVAEEYSVPMDAHATAHHLKFSAHSPQGL